MKKMYYGNLFLVAAVVVAAVSSVAAGASLISSAWTPARSKALHNMKIGEIMSRILFFFFRTIRILNELLFNHFLSNHSKHR